MAEQNDALRITTREMHTGGEPLRIIESGFPPPKGNTILDKRRYIKEHYDHLRKFLMFEPRGHQDMYGTIIVQADQEGADFGAIFFHNEGYSTMCGHAVIALGRYAIDTGLVKNPSSPETRVGIQCPCGVVQAFVEYENGLTGNVRFNSVPSFVFASDVRVNVPGYGQVTVDIAYGGAFYALTSASSYGLDLKTASIQQIKDAASSTTDVLREQFKIEHPEDSDLAFLYGTIITDGNDDFCDEPSHNVCVFAEKEVDRSPCGSGVTARVAQQMHRNKIRLNQKRKFCGPAGALFTAGPVKEVKYGKYSAVIVEVSGKGHYSGSSTFTLESDDDIGKGFLV